MSLYPLKRKCSCGNWESGPRNTANVFKDKQKWLDFIKTEGLKGGAVIGRRLEQDYQRLRESRSLWFLTKKEISCRWMFPVLLPRN